MPVISIERRQHSLVYDIDDCRKDYSDSDDEDDDDTDASNTSRDNDTSNRTPPILVITDASSTSGYSNWCGDCQRVSFHAGYGIGVVYNDDNDDDDNNNDN